jgi:uncharacterized protein (DUF1499 family)
MNLARVNGWDLLGCMHLISFQTVAHRGTCSELRVSMRRNRSGYLSINPKVKKMNQTSNSLNELPPCPNSPNCVCSDGQQNGHWISPIRFTGSAKVAWAKWLNIIKEEKTATIIESNDASLRATFRTPLLKFEDDFQSRLDSSHQLIHIRSASRVGYWDLGTNRRRVERLRKAFNRSMDSRD